MSTEETKKEDPPVPLTPRERRRKSIELYNKSVGSADAVLASEVPTDGSVPALPQPPPDASAIL